MIAHILGGKILSHRHRGLKKHSVGKSRGGALVNPATLQSILEERVLEPKSSKSRPALKPLKFKM